MSTIRGFSHVATNTADLDRFVRFYCGVLGLEHQVTVRMTHPPYLRHTAIAVEPGCVLHAFEVEGYDPQADGIPNEMGRRGRIDHFGLMVDDRDALHAMRDRLVAAGASNGDVTPLGPVWSVHFVDPDGLEGEINCPNLTWSVADDERDDVEQLSRPDLLLAVAAKSRATASE